MARFPRHRTSNPERDDPPRRLGRAGLDALPEAMRGTLGKRAILAVLKADGHRLPPGVDDDDRTAPWLRMSAAATPRDATARATTAGRPTDGNAFDYTRPWLPVDENGREIPPDPDDPRFDRDGNPKADWVKDGGAKAWGLRNSRWNPDLDDGKGDFEYYANRPDLYYRDPKNPDRWVKRKTVPRKPDTPTNIASPKSNSPFPPPPLPPIADPRTKKGGKAIARWIVEFGTWYEQKRQMEKDRR